MNSIEKGVFITLLCSLSFAMFSQNIAINTSGSVADTGALLDLSNHNSTAGTAGFLPPKVTLTSSTSLSPVAGTVAQLTGLMVYNTSTSTSNGLWGAGLYYWTGGAWVCISCCRPTAVGTGTISYTHYGYTVTYNVVGTTVFTPSCTGNVQVLVVAGGGGGGTNGGGGGGGGGVIYDASYAVTANTSVTVTVGAGGSPSTNVIPQGGTNGGNSVFGTLTAIGGGLGGDRDVLQAGYTGGSGGGGGGGLDSTVDNGGSYTTGQGNTGGSGTGTIPEDPGCSAAGGGGGGADSAGTVGTYNQGGEGGAGLYYFGNTYGGGGGGGTTCYNIDYWSNTPYSCQGPAVDYSTPGTGGAGGGGSGEGYYPAASGGANTGGGGGGGGGVCGSGGAGSGGSGIVIIVCSY